MMTRRIFIQQQAREAVVVGDDQINIAIVIYVATGYAATSALQPGVGLAAQG